MAQVELLVVHGADPGALDRQGNTPSTCAKYENKLMEYVMRFKKYVICSCMSVLHQQKTSTSKCVFTTDHYFESCLL